MSDFDALTVGPNDRLVIKMAAGAEAEDINALVAYIREEVARRRATAKRA